MTTSSSNRSRKEAINIATIAQKTAEAEAFVTYDLIRQGFTVSTPQVVGSYDLIAERNGEMQRVQVKTVRKRYDRNGEIVLDCTDGAGNRYPTGALDLFAGYDPDERRVYYVTAAQVGGKREIWIDRRKVFMLPIGKRKQSNDTPPSAA